MPDPTQRFSNRVEDYIRFRPSYPVEVVDLLRSECGLNSESVVADIGSGTGKLTELLLHSVCRVFAVEPNREMREAAERLLAASAPRFTSINGSAEATTLPNQNVDLITAGQAFHWFDRVAARAEFQRILKPRGYAALIWNDRRTDTSPFLLAYEELLRQFGTDYVQVNHRNLDAASLRQFLGGEMKEKSFPYSQRLDFAALSGRLLSSSYAPVKGQPKHDEMMDALRSVFDKYQERGEVSFDYDTRVFYAQIG